MATKKTTAAKLRAALKKQKLKLPHGYSVKPRKTMQGFVSSSRPVKALANRIKKADEALRKLKLKKEVAELKAKAKYISRRAR